MSEKYSIGSDRPRVRTACYLDLPTELIELPDGAPGRLLRFMNDQQCCRLWYLHLRLEGEATVVSAWPESHDAATGETLEDVSTVSVR